MSNEHIKIGNTENVISVKVSLVALIGEKKPGMYLSYCPALDLYSQGDTEEEAEKNIIEASELFIKSCLKRGTLNKVLTACGFHSVDEKMHKSKAKQLPSWLTPHHRKTHIPAEIPVLVA